MSFSITGSGHTATDEDFEALADALQEAANAIGAHTDSPFTLTVSGQHNGEDFFGQYTSGSSNTDETGELAEDVTGDDNADQEVDPAGDEAEPTDRNTAGVDGSDNA